MFGIASKILKTVNIAVRSVQITSNCSLGIETSSLLKAENCFLNQIRTKVRCYFPRPNEVRRVRRHGWEHRMSTKSGRRIIMRRFLKGCHVLTH